MRMDDILTKKLAAQAKGHHIPRCFICERRLKGHWIKHYNFDLCPACSKEHDLPVRDINVSDAAVRDSTTLQSLMRGLGRVPNDDEAGTVSAMAELAARFPRGYALDLVGMALSILDDEAEDISDESIMGYLHSARAVQMYGPKGGGPVRNSILISKDQEREARQLLVLIHMGLCLELIVKFMVMERLGLLRSRDGRTGERQGKAKDNEQGIGFDASDNMKDLIPNHPSWYKQLVLEEHSADLGLIDEVGRNDPEAPPMLDEIKDYLWAGVLDVLDPDLEDDEDGSTEDISDELPFLEPSGLDVDAPENPPTREVPLPLPKDVVEDLKSAIENGDWDLHYFFDLKNRKLVSYNDNNEMPGDEELKQAIEEGFGKRYLGVERLDSKEAYAWMEDFVDRLEGSEAKDALAYALRNNRSFRRFKDALLEYPTVREQWFRFHDLLLEDKAREWCKENLRGRE
jgi:hypothetical protein